MSSALALTKVTQLTVRVESGPARGRAHQMQKSPISIGRDADNDIVFSEDVKMSRRHAEIVFENGKWILRNISQKNGLRINGHEVLQGTLSGTTKVEIGGTELMLSFAGVEPSLQSQSALKFSSPSRTGAARQFTQSPGASAKKGSSGSDAKTKKIRLFLVGGIALIAIFNVISNSNLVTSKKATVGVAEKTILNIQESKKVILEIEKKQELSGQKLIQYQLAQEQYVKGFRDYRQGQYSRAMIAFNAALGFSPNHELAKKYYFLSKRKFDEVVQSFMVQGNRYLGKNNFRLCKSSYANVMKMIKDSNDPIYKEAKQYHDECSLHMEDKF